MLKKSHLLTIFPVLLFFGALGLISLVLSQPRSPHGGTLKKAGDYFIEMKNIEKKMYAYLLDKKLKTVNTNDIFGEIKFFFPDSTDVNIRLKPTEENAFTCEMPGGFNSCKITFNIIGKSVSAVFGAPTQIALKNNK